jgi:hypothetical protein
MSDDNSKARKKEAKAAAKIEKARAKAAIETAHVRGAPEGVGVSVRKSDGVSELVVSGLTDGQLQRIVPGITKEIVIAMTEEKSAFRAGLLRFVREGIFQTVIKVVAGLVVGYLLIRFGLG